MPPSDSEDDENIIGTGPDFQFVLENSAKASEHLQLKAEKEWENKHQEFNNEFFALNLKACTEETCRRNFVTEYVETNLNLRDLVVREEKCLKSNRHFCVL